MEISMTEEENFKRDLRWATHIAAVAGLLGLFHSIFRDISQETLLGIIWPVAVSLFAFTPEVLMASKAAKEFGLNTRFSLYATWIILCLGIVLLFFSVTKILVNL